MRGHLFPAVAILDELRGRGHEVSVRTLAAESTKLRELGLDAAPLAPAVESLPTDDWRARTPPGAARRAALTLRERAAHDGPDLSRAIEEVGPDLLLVDVASWGALGAAEAWGGPYAALCPFPLPVPSRDAPPFGPGFPPARHLAGRLRDRLGWALVERGLDQICLRELNLMRSALGAPPLEHVHDLYTRPPALLYTTAEGFEYPRSDWPANVVFVGPCTWEPSTKMPPALASVELPLVLVTTSSDFQDDGRLVRTALEALAGEPCHVVATLPATGPGDLRPPANAIVEGFVPHEAVLARASCAITHGGMGVTQKALAAGVPVCAVPHGRDQFEVARRVRVAEAGTILAPWRLSADRLRRRAREAMAMRAGAERVAAALAATSGPVGAADALERLLPS